MTCAATVLVLVIGVPSALAKSQTGHTARISGVVLSINTKRHTLKLRVARPIKQRKASARAASAGGSSTIVVAYGDATVSGAGGAVAVGDDVTVTIESPAGHTAVAATIDVTGQAGGAAAPTGTAAPGGASTVDPAAGADSSTTPTYDTFTGTVVTVGTTSLQVSVAGDGPLAGQTVTVNLNADTRYKGATADGTAFTLGDVQIGDQVRIYTTSLDPQSLVAVLVGDGAGGTGGSSPPPPPPSTPPSTGSQTQRFGGVVTAVRGDGLTVTVVSGGPLNGQSVIVSVPPTTSFQDDPQTGAGQSLTSIAVGDAVEIHTDSEAGSPIVAVAVTDDGVWTGA
jgi:hypothetical protein